MTQWINERYITRCEHQEVVAYYRKLVLQLYGKVKQLRTEVESQSLPAGPPGITPATGHQDAATPVSGPAPYSAEPSRDNVIHFDFRRRP
jgi:hypothetical protein